MKDKALPEGWNKINITKVFTQISTTGKNIATKDCLSVGKYPVIDQGAEYISGYFNDETKVIPVENKVIVFGDHTRNFKLIDFDFIVGADGVKIFQPAKDIDPDFFYYQCLSLNLPNKGYHRHFRYLKECDFIYPSFSQQQKLAKKFTALLSQVAEIKQRLEKIPALLKTYRQSVLARAVNGELSAKWREENGVSLESWNKAKIHNLGSIFSGKTPSKKNPCYWENGTVYWVSAKDMKFDEITFSSDLITEKAVNETKLKICPTDTILMVMRSGIIAHTFPVALTKVEVTINQDLKALRPKKGFAQPKFIFYLLKGNEQKILEKCSKAGTTVASIEMPEFEKFVFDIPSLEEQNYITQAVEKHLNFANQLEAQVNAALERVNLMTQAILAKGFRGELL
ncbi:restriction endonuclease subunit S [Glaesserella parasuis]|uniref:restriction endonuclease subunit S n=1 Tax=Glaesserella parasuis TaxID=738 RepID=UPI00243668AE|nr:restriction endonuclease subunit S [Glaesserella parasuis]MDD2174934.1 restriction endonuclease subunit S [Glaesserella parasuis]MDG6308968.1 restriction endonuclease subunit S [Glaesserella parasuis]MDG6447920.1 restriction endonuclease subunit S [Glaesserella parasuis]MDO9872823.1 restriction endonuclease subunit S [Glaesserella parasuis]MDP0302126.1 restriction endonuclease subunit S [Glaesserella parasuis]